MTTATWVSIDTLAGSSVPGSAADAVVTSTSAAATSYGPNPPVGTIRRFYDSTGKYGIGEFIYLPGVASLAVGDVVNYLISAGVSAATDATVTRWAGGAYSGMPVAIATTANTATTTFSWYQIGGAAVVNVSGTVAAGDKAMYLTTATVATAAVSGKQIIGMVAASAQSVPASLQAIYTLDRPHVQSQVI